MTATSVSVIIPCYNEEATIRKLLDAIRDQTYPLSSIEVVIADGMSTDNTRGEVASYIREYPELCVRIVDNPKRIIPAALNRAIEAAGGSVVVRLDGHAVPYPDFLERCVKGLTEQAGEAIGSVLEIRPGAETWVARSIAAATGHPLGVGDALYRHGQKARFVDTFAFGAFRRELVDKIGYYDESLLTNEDYEFNSRIRSHGGRIWLDPAIRSTYYSRVTLGQLARQYWRYGFWKWRMLRRHPRTLRWRQALPPAFVLGLIAFIIAAIGWPPLGIGLGLYACIYLAILVVAGVARAVKERAPFFAIGLPVAIAVMHLSWGTAFLWSVARGQSA